jgi:hypothetical protein
MTEKVIQLVPNEISASFRFDPEVCLENMKGTAPISLLIIAQGEDGSLKIDGNCNAGEALVLMELAKHDIVFERED